MKISEKMGLRNKKEIFIFFAVITIVGCMVFTGVVIYHVNLHVPDLVGANNTQTDGIKKGIIFGLNDCDGFAIKNSTGDKVCTTWDELHDDLLLLKELNIKNTTTWKFHVNQTNLNYTKYPEKDLNLVPSDQISWWEDINGTHDCKVYRYDSNSNGFDSYSFNGVGCTDYQAAKFDKIQYSIDHPETNQQLTEGTNVCTEGFDCRDTTTLPKCVDNFANTPCLDSRGNTINAKVGTYPPTLTEATNCGGWGPCNPIPSIPQTNQTNKLLAFNYCINYFNLLKNPMFTHDDLVSCVKDTLENTK